ncbi:MAG TPA: glycosyltransferase family 1 protein [Prolixibacteraceae bacterium]|nr:glycosyltransferase family 1 protein [Prolixibacteraceae bacterium]
MNIIFDNIIFSLQQAGGISVVWFELIKRALKDPDLNAYFLEELNQNIFRKQLNIPDEYRLKNPYASYPLSIQRYLNQNKLAHKGIFHSSYYRIAKNPNAINITTVHDFTYEYYVKGLPKLTHSFQKGLAIKNSKKIICVSQNTKTDLLKFYPGIKEDQIKIIYNGVDDTYQPIRNKDTASLKQMIPFSSNEFVLYVGDRKSTYKNFNLTVNACKISHNPLVMVGGGALTIQEKLLLDDKLGINHYQHLKGIHNEQLNLIYNHALCLTYPSLYEGFGIPILEAQKAGCPIISTNYSSIPEVAGKGAILIDKVTEHQIAEMINLLKKDSALVATLKEEGFKNSQCFSWDKCYQQIKQLYKEVDEENF